MQQDVKARQQIDREELWIKERIGQNKFTEETASTLGVKSLTGQLDKMIIFLMEGFLRESKEKAMNFSQKVNIEIGKLGINPSDIKLEDLSCAIGKKLEEAVGVSNKKMEKKVNSLWEIVCADDDNTTEKELAEKMEKLSLADQFCIETEEILAARVK